MVGFASSHPSAYPLCFAFKMRGYGGRTGILTNKIAGDCLVLLNMIARVGYGGEHVELDLVHHGKSGFLELGGHRQM